MKVKELMEALTNLMVNEGASVADMEVVICGTCGFCCEDKVEVYEPVISNGKVLL